MKRIHKLEDDLKHWLPLVPRSNKCKVVISEVCTSSCAPNSVALFTDDLQLPSSSIDDICDALSTQLATTLYQREDQLQFEIPYHRQEVQRQIPYVACRPQTWRGLCVQELICVLCDGDVKNNIEVVFNDGNAAFSSNLLSLFNDGVVQQAREEIISDYLQAMGYPEWGQGKDHVPIDPKVVNDVKELISSHAPDGLRMETLERLFEQMRMVISGALENMDGLQQMRDLKFDQWAPHTTADVVNGARACIQDVRIWLSSVNECVSKNMIATTNVEFCQSMKSLLWQHEGDQSELEAECISKLGVMMSVLEKTREMRDEVYANPDVMFRELFPMRQIAASLNATRAWISDRLDLVQIAMGKSDLHKLRVLYPVQCDFK